MYKLISIAAIATGVLLLAPGAKASPMNTDVAQEPPATNAGQRGRQVASERANINASFNRSLQPGATGPGAAMSQRGSAGRVTAVPEPGTLGLLAAAVIGAGMARRRRRGD